MPEMAVFDIPLSFAQTSSHPTICAHAEDELSFCRLFGTLLHTLSRTSLAESRFDDPFDPGCTDYPAWAICLLRLLVANPFFSKI